MNTSLLPRSPAGLSPEAHSGNQFTMEWLSFFCFMSFQTLGLLPQINDGQVCSWGWVCFWREWELSSECQRPPKHKETFLSQPHFSLPSQHLPTSEVRAGHLNFSEAPS